ncbi:hypothetical protein [uncultured Microbulbifer sp.]|uniref:hypothetical protein n=1 Tax=uncultured Microbulbifer sp. TaxID=348147 RepID=UPI00262AAE82|nr:hypothetical protein [uncultured Microbulbifer sp.]
MPFYIVNRNPNPATLTKPAHHEVHDIGQDQFPGLLATLRDCLPLQNNWLHLGFHLNCQSAVEEAMKRPELTGKAANGCYYCANGCHTM